MLPDVLDRLPALCIVVLAGRVAGLAREVVAVHASRAAILTMPHPSPTYVCTSPEVATRIKEVLSKASQLLRADKATIARPT